jgi:signal peptidase I
MDQPEAGSPKPEARPGLFRENLEAIVVAIVIALLIRQYALEAFVIPTGSMAPTLLGAHVDVECTNCGKEQPVSETHIHRSSSVRQTIGGNAQGRCEKCGKHHTANLLEDAFVGGRAEITCDRCGARVMMAPVIAPRGDGDRTVRATCSNCGIEFENRVEAASWPAGDRSRGDRILVNKFIYRFETPRRYEIAVFKFPKRPEDNFIKRLIGLGGETIDVRDGDIYADGKIARKPEEIQEELWRPVHEARFVEQNETAAGRRAAWRVEGGAWERIQEGKAWKGVPAAGAGTGTAWLVYNRDIRDENPYNEQAHSGGKYTVGDLRVRFRARGEADGASALARITVDEEVVEAEATCDAGDVVLRWRGQEYARKSLGASTRRERAIELWRVDCEIVLRVDGETVTRLRLDEAGRARTPGTETRKSEVRIGVAGGAAVFEDLSIDRDVYYLASIPGVSEVRFPYRVPDGTYFFLGDNSSNSTDSRSWKTVPAGHMVGRAFLVFWPAVPGDFAVRRIR